MESYVMLSPRAEEKRRTPRYPLERLAKIQLGQGIARGIASLRMFPAAECGSTHLDIRFLTNFCCGSLAMGPPRMAFTK
jgi:hypothetical protein